MMLRTLLHRPIAVTMSLIAIVTLGILAFQRIPVSLMPDIDVPRIVVQMSAQGSSAREIEQQIVSQMRQQLSQVAGLKRIEILLEGGGTLNESFIREGLVDEVFAFIAPKIVGGADAKTPVEGLGLAKMAQALKLEDVKVERYGEDLLVRGLVSKDSE